MGDYWRDVKPVIKERAAKKKSDNKNKSLSWLDRKNIKYKKLSEYHFRVRNYDFWPTTGVFINIKTKKKGRGISNLVRFLDGQK